MTNVERAEEIIWRETDAAQGGDYAAQALAEAGLLAPERVEPEGTVEAISQDGHIGPLHYCPRANVECMTNPHNRKNVVTVFGHQVHDPELLARQIMSAAAYAEEHTDGNG